MLHFRLNFFIEIFLKLLFLKTFLLMKQSHQNIFISKNLFYICASFKTKAVPVSAPFNSFLSLLIQKNHAIPAGDCVSLL